MDSPTETINNKIEAAVATAVRKDSVQASNSAIAPITEEVIKRITPLVLHATSNERWYESRVTIGAIVAVVAGLASILGYSIDAEDQKFWIDNIAQLMLLVSGAVSVAGGVISWYGRWRAKKPLGS